MVKEDLIHPVCPQVLDESQQLPLEDPSGAHTVLETLKFTVLPLLRVASKSLGKLLSVCLLSTLPGTTLPFPELVLRAVNSHAAVLWFPASISRAQA